MSDDSERARAQINYKSGRHVLVTVKSLTITRNRANGGLTMKWEGMRPEPLLLNPDEVESVWRLP